MTQRRRAPTQARQRPAFEEQRRELLRQLRAAREQGDEERTRVLLSAIEVLALHEGVAQLVRASEAEHEAVKDARRAAARLQAAVEALALGSAGGSVADVQAAEAVLQAAEARARAATVRRWLRTEQVRQTQQARREAALRYDE